MALSTTRSANSDFWTSGKYSVYCDCRCHSNLFVTVSWHRCASGGFTHYALLGNPKTRGAGISLPEEEGGHPWLLPNDLNDRFELIWRNLLSYDLGPASLRLPIGHSSFPFFGRTFDLVLLDGHILRTQAESEHTRASDYCRLLLAQFQIGLRCVMEGGTIVMKLSRVEDEISARVLFMLDKIANELYVHKPTSIHQNRATFYAIAKGVRYGETLDSYVAALRKLWYDMTYGGSDGRGTWIPQRQALEDVVSFEELTEETNLDRLVALGADAWKTQLDALKGQHLRYEHTRRAQGVPDLSSRRGGRFHA
jgi:hypothetical protein